MEGAVENLDFVRFVDGSLDPILAGEIEAVIKTHPEVAASIADDIRAASAVKTHLVPSCDALDLPPDPKLDQTLAEMIADPKAWGDDPEESEEDTVVPLRASPKKRAILTQPGWGMMAASIAACLMLGVGGYLYDQKSDQQRIRQIASRDDDIRHLTEERDTLRRQTTDLDKQLASVTAARDLGTVKFKDAEAAIAQLKAR